MRLNSLYITQSAFIKLCDYPFSIIPALRNAFIPIFSSKNCFADMGPAIYDFYRVHDNNILKHWNHSGEILAEEDVKPNPVTRAPFIANMGQVCFNTRSLYFLDYAYQKQAFAFELAKRVPYWRNFTKDYTNPVYFDKNIFGYDRNLKDQRMNFLYFELRPPLHLKAYYNSKCMAYAKLYVHIYPCGYIGLILSCRLVQSVEIDDETDFLSSLNEVKPWNNTGKWIWKSKLGEHKINNLINIAVQNISMSIFCDEYAIKENPKWNAGILAGADTSDQYFKPISSDNEWFKIKNSSITEYLRVIDGIHYYYGDNSRSRSSLLHSYWKMMHLQEFIQYKIVIYDTYIKYLTEKIDDIRNLRLERKNIFKIENILDYNFYNSDIPLFLKALDSMVLGLNPFHRTMYSYLANHTKLNEKRGKLKTVLENWIKEIEGWNSRENKFFSLLKAMKALIQALV